MTGQPIAPGVGPNVPAPVDPDVKGPPGLVRSYNAYGPPNYYPYSNPKSAPATKPQQPANTVPVAKKNSPQ